MKRIPDWAVCGLLSLAYGTWAVVDAILGHGLWRFDVACSIVCGWACTVARDRLPR